MSLKDDEPIPGTRDALAALSIWGKPKESAPDTLREELQAKISDMIADHLLKHFHITPKEDR